MQRRSSGRGPGRLHINAKPTELSAVLIAPPSPPRSRQLRSRIAPQSPSRRPTPAVCSSCVNMTRRHKVKRQQSDLPDHWLAKKDKSPHNVDLNELDMLDCVISNRTRKEYDSDLSDEDLEELRAPPPEPYQIKDTWSPPRFMGWGVEYALNNELFGKYKVLAHMVNKVYQAKQMLETATSNFAVHKARVERATQAMRRWMVGEGQILAIWKEIDDCCGVHIPMAPSLEEAVLDILGPEVYVLDNTSYSSVTRIPPRAVDQLPNPLPYEIFVDVFDEFSTLKLNGTLQKLYVAINLLLNEYWVRLARDNFGPPTVAVGTRALAIGIMELKDLCDEIIDHVEIVLDEPHFPMPRELREALSYIGN